VKVGNLFPPARNAELREALRGPNADKIKARIAFACVKQQAEILRYLFPDTRRQWGEEARQGRTVEWIKKL
jgi:hypothetical protein